MKRALLIIVFLGVFTVFAAIPFLGEPSWSTRKMIRVFGFWDWMHWGFDHFCVFLYAASVGAFVIRLRWHPPRVHSYFSSVFFLSLCPLLFMMLGDLIHYSPAIIDLLTGRSAYSDEMFWDADLPLYFGGITTLLLVALYSVCYARSQARNRLLSTPVQRN